MICQSLVRTLRIPHAETNAAILPRVIEAMVPRAGKQMTSLARAVGHEARPARQADREPGTWVLAPDADESLLDEAVELIRQARARSDPGPPDEHEIRGLIAAAW